MTIEARTCANCGNFNAESHGEEPPPCWNFTKFAVRLGSTELRDPVASDTCPEHLTHEEDAFQDVFIDQALRAGGLAAATLAADACEMSHRALRRAAQA